ncbi:MAG TPA: hypothetical protein VFP87_13990 [Chitinophagaceae bacterium]|nr:hypothetical protein [Chitinophagaceae bacterium]
MQTLANKINVYTGIEEEKVKAALLIIAAHVREKYPMLRGCAEAILDIKELSLEKDGIIINRFDVN